MARVTTALAVLVLGAAGALPAQSYVAPGDTFPPPSARAETASRDSVPPLPGKPVFSRGDLVALAAFTAGTAALIPFDERLADWMRSDSRQNVTALRSGATVFRLLADPGAIAIATGMYAAGRLARRPGTADAGLHATEAIVVSGAVTGFLKLATGRARPYLSSPTKPSEFPPGVAEFRPWRGRGGYTSFPSGHTTAAFAAAAALSSELRRSRPGTARWASPVLYGTATLGGLSRMYDNKHWATDVAAGAAIGTLAGWKIVGLQHDRPQSRLDRWLLRTSAAPARGGGMLLLWTVRTP